jgi:hypothetical protein
MNVLLILVSLAFAGFTAYAFIKAGLHKLQTPAAKLLEAGWGWVAKAPKGTTKFIGLSELLGGLGVILAPVAVTAFNFDWAQIWGVLAGAGLTVVMVLANIVHIARKEFKYTYKAGLMLLVVSLVTTILLAFYPTA